MAEKRLITPDDLAEIVYVDDPQCSPDSRWVAYVHHQPSLSDNTYHTSLYLAAVDGGEPTRLTYTQQESQPRWSPDGRQIAFVSARSGLPQLYLLPMFGHGGEARQITRHINGATTPVWSPDGQQIAFLARLSAAERAHEDDGSPQAATAEEPDGFFDPLVVDRIPYRDGTTVHDGRFTQIYLLDLASGAPRRLTAHDAHYSAPVWSPDGRTLYTTRIARVGGDEYWRYANLYAIDTATGVERALLAGEHTLHDLAISPDGRYLAFNRRDGRDTASQYECWLLPLDTGEPRIVNAALDRPITHLRWMRPDLLVVVAATEGRSAVYGVALDLTMHPLADEAQHVVGLSTSGDGLVVLSVSTLHNPSELVAVRAGQRTPLTYANDALLAARHVQPAHELWFDSPYGRIQGWYILPPDYVEGERRPLAVNIHGGPQYMWSSHERTMWHEWQCHAAAGYVVFFCNPRGSEGYGNAFNRALAYNWGELAMQDVMAGVDAVIARGLVDPARMVLTGGSFGGFVTAWITAHTDRFRAAVAQRGVYNLVSFYGTTDIPTFAETQFDRLPWHDYDYLWEKSPLRYAQHIHTPMLIIHSENDFRVAIEQAEQLFTWLHRMGKKVRFVRFPRDGHEMTRSGEPKHRLHSLQEIIAWWHQFIA